MILKILKYIFKLIIIEKNNSYNIIDNYYLSFNVLKCLQLKHDKKRKIHYKDQQLTEPKTD